MNTILIFSAILVSSQLVLASKKPDINALLFFSQQTTNNCKTPGLQCKDCQTIQYCSSSNLESLFEIHCEDQSRLRPYCDMDSNTCVKDKPTVCEIPETSFHCPGTGYYPDLEDCSNYYICDESKVATKMSCPIGSNWIQGDQSCTAGIYCRSYSPKLGQCKGKTNKLVAYAPDKNMYVLCLSNGPILFQCPNRWEIFDEAEVTCKFECTQNGFFPNPSDPRKFYSCTKEGKGYVSVTLECPEGYEFAELGAGQGICTLRTTTTTTTTEAPAVELTTILEEYSEAAQDENNNDDEQIVEEDDSENNNNQENHPEELEEHNPEVGDNNEEEHHSEEIVNQSNSVNNNDEEHIEEHHSEEIAEQNIEENNGSGHDNLVEEEHKEAPQENDEITGTEEIDENQESVLLFINVRISLQLGPVSLRAHHTDLIESQSCEQSGWSCKDCGTLQRCGPDNIFKFQISCADQFPDRPYCDPSIGRCVSDRHVCSEMKDPEFKCPDVGIYPDLTDCRRYISCRSKGEVGLIYSCLFQSVYNPIAKRCITHSYCYDPIIDCNGDYKTMAYNLDPSLYIVCRGDQKPLIKDCGSKMLEYDPSLLACDFKCKEEGRFAHPTNNTLFYICVYNNNEIVRMMGLCREGTIYDEIYDTCVYNFDISSTTHLMEVTTELETFTDEETLETTTNNFYETTVDNNDQTLETTASNVEQNSETTLNEEQNLETTTAANVDQNSETTLNDELILETTTTSEDALPSVTIDDGQETSTHDAFEEDTTTESLITKETTTIRNRPDTTFTTDNIEADLTTNSNIVNVTNSSEESLETTEKNSPEETDETEENDMNEETEDTNEDNTKEDVEQTDSEQTEETEEIQSKSNESQKTEEEDKSNNNSNEWKNEKHKCRGRICLPKWKIPGFLKQHNSNK